jgi:hypothetical protein
VAQPRRSSRRRKTPYDTDDARKKNLIGLGLIAGVLALMGGAFYFYEKLPRVAFDPETGCPDGGGVSLTAVLIDGSDPLSPRQQAFLRNHLEAIKEEIPRGGALEVYRLGTDREALLEPVVSVCNPGRGGDADPWTESRKRADKLWNDTFQAKLQGVFDTLLNAGEEKQSPIFEAIQSVGITSLSKPHWQDKPKRLVLVSDMLQFTDNFSHYHGSDDFKAFSGTPYYRKVRTDLSGVDVTVFYIPRETARGAQSEAHREFWKAYFLDQGARPGRPSLFVYVEG